MPLAASVSSASAGCSRCRRDSRGRGTRRAVRGRLSPVRGGVRRGVQHAARSAGWKPRPAPRARSARRTPRGHGTAGARIRRRAWSRCQVGLVAAARCRACRSSPGPRRRATGRRGCGRDRTCIQPSRLLRSARRRLTARPLSVTTSRPRASSSARSRARARDPTAAAAKAGGSHRLTPSVSAPKPTAMSDAYVSSCSITPPRSGSGATLTPELRCTVPSGVVAQPHSILRGQVLACRGLLRETSVGPLARIRGTFRAHVHVRTTRRVGRPHPLQGRGRPGAGAAIGYSDPAHCPS